MSNVNILVNMKTCLSYVKKIERKEIKRHAPKRILISVWNLPNCLSVRVKTDLANDLAHI